MTLGEFGSTLNDELNRLANGGTYRDKVDMVDEALAAKQWANRENINPYSTDTVGILNEIAGLGLDKRNWLDFNGVCNYIAGTTGLPAAAALRQVYPTTDLLTGVASYYVDSLYPTGLTSTPGYVYLNGAAGNNMSTPDSNALDISSDIDIRAQIALDDWTPAAASVLINKFLGTGNQRSYSLFVDTNGTLVFNWSSDGTNQTQPVSTVATGIADGATKWVRVTLDVDNGSSQNETKFWLSDDGITWTQLGTTITNSGVTSIYNSTTQLTIGTNSGTSASGLSRGKFFRAQVLNGIDGTVAFDANFETSITSLLQTSFTESSANAATVTINRSGSAYRSAGITAAGYLYPGATNTFSASATDFLNFGASDSFTLIAASRVFGASSANNERFLAKGTTTNVGSNGRYILRRTASANTANGFISDGTNQANPISTESIATGAQFTETFVINRSTQVATLYLNTSQSATASTSTVGSLANTASFGIGGVFAADPLNGEIYAAAVFRQALTAAQIRQISNYFANREVYL